MRRAGIGDWLGAIILWAFAVGLGGLSVWAALENQVPPTIAFGLMAIACGAGGVLLVLLGRGAVREDSDGGPDAAPDTARDAAPPATKRLPERLRAWARRPP